MADFIIVTGFDRSGTTLLANMLASVDGVECLMQPFHETTFHLDQWKRETDDSSLPEMEDFFDKLLDGQTDHLESPYHPEHSTTDTIDDDKTYIIKSTKLHTKVEWLHHHYPDMKVVGLFRETEAIVTSLFRNGFWEGWYGYNEYREFLDHVKEYELSGEFNSLAAVIGYDKLDTLQANVMRMAVMTIARNSFLNRWMVSNDKTEDQFSYKVLLDVPKYVCSSILEREVGDGVEEILDEDQNLWGKKSKGPDHWKEFLPEHHKNLIEVVRKTEPTDVDLFLC